MTPNPRDPQSVSLLADLSGHPPEGVLFWSGAGIAVPPRDHRPSCTPRNAFCNKAMTRTSSGGTVVS